MDFPLYQEIPYQDPALVFEKFANNYGSIFLDSALKSETLGRYSYIAIEPFEVIESKNGLITINDHEFQKDPFIVLNEKLKIYKQKMLPNLPIFQGGFAGYFGYELYQHLEKIPFAKTDDMKFPDMILGIYDLVLAFDNICKKTYIFSSGFPEKETVARRLRAKNRMDYLLQKISVIEITAKENFTPLPRVTLKSFFTKDSYSNAVNKVINYILDGDIFEANLSQRFKAELPELYNDFALYQHLRKINPASFAAYLNFSPFKILSASPERFLKLSNQEVEARPIKGTRRRGKNQEEDKVLAINLLESEKDNAENVMIVDLMRNDLSRVCEPNSITVPQLCGLESFATVHHLVSVVKGKLQSNKTCIDLLKASFPGGSITGAPKIRSMEIIAEIEPNLRGPYCGSVGYINFSGAMDTSITIRTFTISNNSIAFQVGGAIVADSLPEEEYKETLTKGKALVAALCE